MNFSYCPFLLLLYPPSSGARMLVPPTHNNISYISPRIISIHHCSFHCLPGQTGVNTPPCRAVAQSSALLLRFPSPSLVAALGRSCRNNGHGRGVGGYRSGIPGAADGKCDSSARGSGPGGGGGSSVHPANYMYNLYFHFTSAIYTLVFRCV
jgi:hypothetical protein